MIDGFAPGARPLCVFCSKAWSDEMIAAEGDVRSYESCGWADISLKIVCDGCNRLIYEKEIFNASW